MPTLFIYLFISTMGVNFLIPIKYSKKEIVLQLFSSHRKIPHKRYVIRILDYHHCYNKHNDNLLVILTICQNTKNWMHVTHNNLPCTLYLLYMDYIVSYYVFEYIYLFIELKNTT